MCSQSGESISRNQQSKQSWNAFNITSSSSSSPRLIKLIRCSFELFRKTSSKLGSRSPTEFVPKRFHFTCTMRERIFLFRFRSSQFEKVFSLLHQATQQYNYYYIYLKSIEEEKKFPTARRLFFHIRVIFCFNFNLIKKYLFRERHLKNREKIFRGSIWLWLFL